MKYCTGEFFLSSLKNNTETKELLDIKYLPYNNPQRKKTLHMEIRF